MISKRFFVFGIIFLFAFSFASAGWFSDLFKKKEITGNAISLKRSCEDSDGNLGLEDSKFIKGTTIIRDKKGIIKTKIDKCIKNKKLREYYCGINKIKDKYFSCTNGCVDGKCKTEKGKLLLIVKDLLILELQTDLDIWKQDVKNEYDYEIIQKTISIETPDQIKNFIKSQDKSGNLKGVLFIGNIPTVLSNLCMEEYDYCHSDHYYTDLDDSCFSILKTGNRCDGYTCNEVSYYDLSNETKCNDFKESAKDFWIARLTTPNDQGNNISMLSSYFKRNNEYRTGKKLYNHKMLAFYPIVDSDSPSEAEIIRRIFLNQGSTIEKLNYYSGDVNLITDPNESISKVYSEELRKPYEYVVYNGHGSPTSQQGMISDKLMIIKPNALFYQLLSCSVGDFTTDNYLAGNYLFAGNGLFVVAATTPVLVISQFPAIESFKLDNGFNFEETFFNHNFAVHLFGDPTLRLSERTNSDVKITNIDLGQMQIPKDINDFYYKYFNITIKNLGNEKINLINEKREGTNFNEISPYINMVNIDADFTKPVSLESGEEKIFQLKLFVHGSLQPIKFSADYIFYSNAKSPRPNFSLSGELI